MTSPAIQFRAKILASFHTTIALFQFALVAGVPLGEFTQGGQIAGQLPLQNRIFAAFSAILLLSIAGVFLSIIDQGPFKNATNKTKLLLIRIITAYAGIGVILNTITPSTKERIVWAPIALIIMILAVDFYKKASPILKNN